MKANSSLYILVNASDVFDPQARRNATIPYWVPEIVDVQFSQGTSRRISTERIMRRLSTD